MGRPAGFTLVEIIVVLLLMSIVGAVALGRSVTTTQIDLASETEKIRSHLRFAQAEAMKRSDAVWGIKFESGKYWMIKRKIPGSDEEVRLPGVEYPSGSNKVSLPSGFSLTWNPSDTIFFNRIGKPYQSYVSNTDEALNTELTAEMQVTVASGESRIIRIEPETGLVR